MARYRVREITISGKQKYRVQKRILLFFWFTMSTHNTADMARHLIWTFESKPKK